MPSFDIVSRFDTQEIDNAIMNCTREISQRYDFKQSKTSIERMEDEIKVITDDEIKLKQVNDLIITHFVRRGINPKTLKIKSTEKAMGNSIRQIYDLIKGIDQTIAKKINKLIKESKIKVQSKILGEEIRVEGKKKDDLQKIMEMVENFEIDQPLQFTNFRD
ncbi:MAG: hypothetical protein CFH22_00779 [Alphaproteobacteria bacterium MarineAlpha5_Bin12]|nr:YajQ family cyclic di-GMP-binding protein [Pelagibacteraceae bacterium]PPR41365.1 MAG: hypothetical protein CFH22_00779 [Alphaproteobacteria bacterium MarineAlpha5_Bin12]|tara:strand:+ start:16429 stop:16914 length:486 start_codon:yes stop_codon:yes gene_type:complete